MTSRSLSPNNGASLRVQIEEWPPIHMVGANIFNKQSWAVNKGWPPDWGLKEVLTTSHHKKLTRCKYVCERQKAGTHLGLRCKLPS